MIKGEISNIFKVAFLYMATVIGAGFASGQEIIQFFSKYYNGGFYGALLTGVLFSIIGYAILDRVYSERIKSYDEFLFPMMGYFLGRIMEFIVMLFMSCVLSVMVAGLGSILMELTGIEYRYCVVISAIVCLLAIMTNIKGIVAVSSFLSPFLVVGILFVGIYMIVTKDTSVFSLSNKVVRVTNNWVFSSLLYVSYNTILSTVMLTSVLPYLKTKRVSTWGGILGGGMLCLTVLILNFALYFFYPKSITSEMPVLSILQNNNQLLGNIYSVILILAMYTSAITSGYCLSERIAAKMNINYRIVAVVMCALVIPMSSMGFSSLIATLYPVFGYLGLFLVFVILLQFIKCKLTKA
ncbi:hypothetical protein EHE19_017355 [Ruminiclostridium herbifermentans]|uniref:Membrane protein YkvI n=1 Tax=Ruminiclostridium herbifermentans TaxID=2488810 RepID=A0A4U7JHQ3_9FIRM|nr:hypothetical protein [Ruminiclostridium herbifermentans]QNU66594.1 hypothetical protein EHE19_017355 [Ruminiclostridium herbifermentans]